MSNLIALVDLDGTLADYDGALQKEMARIASPNDPDFRSVMGERRPDWLEARRTLITTQPGFWRRLSKLEVGFDVVRNLQGLDFEVHVLTKGPSSKPNAWAEKVEWVREHLPGVEISITENKSLSFGRVLVDDWSPYWQGWLEHRPRGVVIVPAQPWNVGCEAFDPTRVYRYDRSDIRPLHRILKAVKARQDGEKIDVSAIVESCKDMPPV